MDSVGLYISLAVVSSSHRLCSSQCLNIYVSSRIHWFTECGFLNHNLFGFTHGLLYSGRQSTSDSLDCARSHSRLALLNPILDISDYLTVTVTVWCVSFYSVLEYSIHCISWIPHSWILNLSLYPLDLLYLSL